MAENKWIEIVSLRFSSLKYRQAILDIFDQVNHEMEACPDALRHAELYFNNDVETDWSIYLHWENHHGGHPSRTLLGLNIAEAFRSFGLVNHSVWRRKSTGNEIEYKENPV